MSASSSTGSTEGMRSRNGCSAAARQVSAVGSSGVGSSAGMLGPGRLDRRLRDGQCLGLCRRFLASTDVGSASARARGASCTGSRASARPRSARLSLAARQALLRPRRLAPCLGDGCGGFFLCRGGLSAQLLGDVRGSSATNCSIAVGSAGGSSEELAVRRQAAPPSVRDLVRSARLPVSARWSRRGLDLHRLGGPASSRRDEFGIGLRLGVRLDLRLPCQSSLHRRLPVGSFSHDATGSPV